MKPRFIPSSSGLAAFAFALALLTVTSCTTASRTSLAATSNATKQQSLWYLTGENPPKYFPKGVSPDSPTSYEYGEWVYAGENGEPWFIPKGLDKERRDELRKDAFAMRSASQRSALFMQNSMELTAKTLVYTVVAVGEGMAHSGGGYYSHKPDKCGKKHSR